MYVTNDNSKSKFLIETKIESLKHKKNIYLILLNAVCKNVLSILKFPLQVGSWSAMTGYGLAFPHNSKHRSKFNEQLLEYRENGDLERLSRYWLHGVCKPNMQEKRASEPLSIDQFLSAFLLLILGERELCVVIAILHPPQVQSAPCSCWCVSTSMFATYVRLSRPSPATRLSTTPPTRRAASLSSARRSAPAPLTAS